MAQAKLKVVLLRATPDPDDLVALGARLCYAQADIDALKEKVESDDQRAFVERVMQRGHLSVTEHAAFTFAVEGVSRALLAQLTRHRIASFSVQSQRYVSMAKGFDYVIPPAIEALGESEKQEFIIGTEIGVLYELKKRNPDKTFYFPKTAPTCRDMKLITLEKVLHVLQTEENQASVDQAQAEAAGNTLTRMLELSK